MTTNETVNTNTTRPSSNTTRDQQILRLQQELREEDTQHNRLVQALQQAVEEERRRHHQRVQDLQGTLVQLEQQRDQYDEGIDTDYWLSNRIPTNPDQEDRNQRLSREEKWVIKHRVLRWFNRRYRR